MRGNLGGMLSRIGYSFGECLNVMKIYRCALVVCTIALRGMECINIVRQLLVFMHSSWNRLVLETTEVFSVL